MITAVWQLIICVEPPPQIGASESLAVGQAVYGIIHAPGLAQL